MEEIVFDLETDGLIEEVTTIWCATFYNVNKDLTISFYPEGKPDIEHLSLFLEDRKDKYLWICHNLMKYDREVIHKLLDIWLPKENCHDTLIWSQMLYPDIEIPKGSKGKHGLDAWGKRYGVPKPKHEDWSRYSPEMLIRNQEDVKINTKLWLDIRKKVNVV